MGREPNQENPSLLSPNTTATLEESPRKPPLGGGGGSGGDRLKRDEWSEGAVSTLLEAYEAKWSLRNRAKLKGQDWEDVARFVSCRAGSTKSPKTQTQCKNKIESMKKRYRSESSADASSSSWPLYPRLDLLLRGSAPLQPSPPPPNPPLILLEPPTPLLPPPHLLPQFQTAPPPPLISLVTAQNSHESNGYGIEDRVAKEDGEGTRVSEDHISSDENAVETDSSTPALYSNKEKLKSRKMKTRMEKKKKRRTSSREDWDISESIRWLAKVVVRSEQARMDTMREIERMRAEGEAKRLEMDLKRTEIIANTQLEIAKLLAGKGVDSSLRIGRN